MVSTNHARTIRKSLAKAAKAPSEKTGLSKGIRVHSFSLPVRCRSKFEYPTVACHGERRTTCTKEHTGRSNGGVGNPMSLFRNSLSSTLVKRLYRAAHPGESAGSVLSSDPWEGKGSRAAKPNADPGGGGCSIFSCPLLPAQEQGCSKDHRQIEGPTR